MSYSDPADLYTLGGVPRGGVSNPGRFAGSVSVADDTIEIDVHGFATGDSVSFRAEASGSLPAPLVEGATYYAIPSTESRFQVTASAGGAAIDLTTEGERIIVITPLPIASAIAWADRLIDDMLPAHVVPISAPVPEIVRATSAELAGWKVMATTGNVSKSVGELLDFARKRLERWASGVPVRGDNAPATSQLAVGASMAASSRHTSLWRNYGGL